MTKKNSLILKCILLLFGTMLLCSLLFVRKNDGEQAMVHTQDTASSELSEDTEPSISSEPAEIMSAVPVVPQLRNHIFVLILAGNYENIFHEDVILTADQGMLIDDMSYKKLKLSELNMSNNDKVYITNEGDKGKIVIQNIERAQKNPGYYGTLIVTKTVDGYVVVNELMLEDYLKSVVPSEMPSDYPLEALKAQAVCARTYAAAHILSPAYPEYGADLNDSTDFQVYNNIGENEATNEAIRLTEGYIMKYGDEVADAFYYSTSCGVGTISEIWKTKEPKERPYLQAKSISLKQADVSMPKSLCEETQFLAFITSENIKDLDVSEPWYRWTYQVSKPNTEMMRERMCEIYAASPELIKTWNSRTEAYESRQIQELGKLRELNVIRRLPGGVIDELEVVTSKTRILIVGEYNIRFCLADGKSEVIRKDNSSVTMTKLLPSAYFAIQSKKDANGNMKSYQLTGGGFGHGVGMSQNAAKHAAEAGATWKEILTIFYSGITYDVIK